MHNWCHAGIGGGRRADRHTEPEGGDEIKRREMDTDPIVRNLVQVDTVGAVILHDLLDTSHVVIVPAGECPYPEQSDAAGGKLSLGIVHVSKAKCRTHRRLILVIWVSCSSIY